MPASDRTTLGRAAAAAVPDPALSGIELLNDGRAAFAARMDLIRAAEESLDIQYYIWQRDATGLALLGEVQRAADRGVRVRLLIDDHGSPALDRDLAILDTHPKPCTDPVRQRGPGRGRFGQQFTSQRFIEQHQPVWKMRGPHIPRRHVYLHGIAVIAALIQDGIAPECGDARLVGGPIGDVTGKHRAKRLVPPDGGIKHRDHTVDLVGCDVKTRRYHIAQMGRDRRRHKSAVPPRLP